MISWRRAIAICLVLVLPALALYLVVNDLLESNQSTHNANQLVEITPEETVKILPTITEVPVVITVTPTPTPKNDNNFTIDYDYPPVPQAKGTVRVPILTFHNIDYLPEANSGKPYYVTADNFEQMLQYLQVKNYRTVNSQEFYDLVRTGQNPTQKTVMLTFDDGNLNNYTTAFPLLKKYGYIGVFYINTSKLRISSARLKEMSDAGMDIESHTASHLDLAKVTDQAQLNTEIIGSRSVLRSIVKKDVVSVSYPGCTFNSQVVTTAVNAGYKFGVSCGKYIDHNPKALFGLHRMHIYNDVENFKKRLSGMWVSP
jgi:peptidoglycan/xylan/chitin deacetylase (PgdA/CDA1 family)